MEKTYNSYFNIDPRYYAAVTADLIRQGKVKWDKFYPHETFVKLLQTTYRVLSGKASRSIWVEGAYGTGKSHAALTVKSLLEAADQEVIHYFDEFGLSRDLRDKYVALKNNGTILTIHRIGSSDIDTDQDLIVAVQESILAALKEKGIENLGEASIKDAFLQWMENANNRSYFSGMIQDEAYSWDFGGTTADDIVEKLKSGPEQQVEILMKKIVKVLKDHQIGFLRDANQMAAWIKSIIDENHLTAILFIWDEFSEYVKNHPVKMTGFQTLAEISQSYPFYFLIVAHESRNLFMDKDTANKTLDRFEPPVKIELPENMAFRLMAQAMKVTQDERLAEEWASDKQDLNNQLCDARKHILDISKKQSRMGQKTLLTDEELQAIVPMHPYAALVLKHIATIFNSNQRSMFDFIISNDVSDAKGFKWFIQTHGALSDINLLTVDLLWDFFCGKQKMGLNDDVRHVLDSFNMLQLDHLTEDEQRVIKTLLLFQAISLRISGNDLLRPTQENLEEAFNGTNWQQGKASSIATALIDKGILFEIPVAGGGSEYGVANAGGGADMATYQENARKKAKLPNLLANGAIQQQAIILPNEIKNRFVYDEPGTCAENFVSCCRKLKEKEAPNRFKLLFAFAMDDADDQKLEQKILEYTRSMSEECIIVRSLVPLGIDSKNEYINNLAYSLYNQQKDKTQATHYEKQARSVLDTWANKISMGAFQIYTADAPDGQRLATIEDLQEKLREINRKAYPLAVECCYTLSGTMYGRYQLPKGAELGIKQEVSSAYKITQKNQSWENALRGAWHVERYWEKPENQGLPVVQAKKPIDQLIHDCFANETGRVAMSKIWHMLEEKPFGYMPCSASAFLLGFMMKEYAVPEFFWSNGSNTEPMSVEKMKSMIGETINPDVIGKRNYKEQYLVSMTEELRAFLRGTSTIFKIPSSQCTSVEAVRDQVRVKMKELPYPFWCLGYALDRAAMHPDEKVLETLIDKYVGLANRANSAEKSESTLANQIGQLFIQHPEAADAMARLYQKEKAREGMQRYIEQYRDGILMKLAQTLGDGGAYMERLRNAFRSGDANWVWNQETANREIDNVIVEYQIVQESNSILGKSSSYERVVDAWCGAIDEIQIPCSIAQQESAELADFFEALLRLRQNHAIQDKPHFLQLLQQRKEAFNDFRRNEFDYFWISAQSLLDNLPKEEAEKLYHSFEKRQFTKKEEEYYSYVRKQVQDYQKGQLKNRLLAVWQEKTDTKTPRAWSEQYKMPILCMFDSEEQKKMIPVFQCFDRINLEEKETEAAIDVLLHADFYGRLADEDMRDACFMEQVVGDFRILLKDPAKIKADLLGHSCGDPYDWMGSSRPAVIRELKRMRDAEYLCGGKTRAMQVLESMSAEQLRGYLRRKVETDPEFGTQILKDQK